LNAFSRLILHPKAKGDSESEVIVIEESGHGFHAWVPSQYSEHVHDGGVHTVLKVGVVSARNGAFGDNGRVKRILENQFEIKRFGHSE
jgi:hypothetical protein